MHYVNAKGILSAQNTINVYRGCSHGCIYCDSRSKCYGFHHAFEDVEVKRNAPDLLERALKSKRKRCMVSTGSMCDPYIQLEEKLNLTRECLEVIDRYECGAVIQTKSSRILRDLPLLESINDKAKCVVQMTMTTYDEKLCRILEPNVSATRERFETLKTLHDHGIPTIVWLSPILPFINDTEENMKGLLDYCIEAEVKGIINYGMGVTLREGSREYFYTCLDKYFPGMRIRYIKTYGNAYEYISPNSRALKKLMTSTCRSNGIMYKPGQCMSYMRNCPEKYQQMELSDFLTW